MADNKDKSQNVETTGHEWDGIEELNTPLPRWWLWTFYATIVWALGYMVMYPAWPMLTQATAGVLGYSSRAEVAADIAAVNERNAPLEARINELPLQEIAGDAEVGGFAVSGGSAVFRTFCEQCHGAGAGGLPGGYPNLVDDDWLWGGEIEDIYLTIRHGIRVEDDDDTRWSQMPAYGEILEREEIDLLVNYVLALSGQQHDAAQVEAAADLYELNCAGCHGFDGEGNRFEGAPALNDAIWLFGGDADTIRDVIVNARFGVMPAWQPRLTEAQIRQVAVYVHQLGGGE